MPKVSNTRIEIDGKTVLFDIHYNKKDLFHVKDFPQSIFHLIGKSKGTTDSNFATEKQLIDSLRECVESYHKKMTQTRKVIRYKLCASANIRMNKVGHGQWSGERKGINVQSIINGTDYAIGFDYDILLETKTNRVGYNEIKPDGSIGYSRTLHACDIVIDWTIERELAFESLADGMYKLMCKISAALGDEHNAVMFLDSKTKLIQ